MYLCSVIVIVSPNKRAHNVVFTRYTIATMYESITATARLTGGGTVSWRFILSCLLLVVRSVASFSVLFGRHESVIGSNVILCCSQFDWNFSEFSLSTVDPRNKVLYNKFLHDANDAVLFHWLDLFST